MTELMKCALFLVGLLIFFFALPLLAAWIFGLICWRIPSECSHRVVVREIKVGSCVQPSSGYYKQNPGDPGEGTWLSMPLAPRMCLVRQIDTVMGIDWALLEILDDKKPTCFFWGRVDDLRLRRTGEMTFMVFFYALPIFLWRKLRNIKEAT